MIRKIPRFFVDLHDNFIKHSPVYLDVKNIEEVGLIEVLQPTGAKFGNWNFLKKLLIP